MTTLELYPGANVLLVRTDVSNYSESPLEALSVAIELTDPEGHPLNQAQIDHFGAPVETVEFPLEPLPTGTIGVRAILRAGGEEVYSCDNSFEKIPTGPWKDTDLGTDDIVIPPFTPVVVEGQSVSVWGRTYRWYNSLFPVQVTSGGEELLAEPVELCAGGAPRGRRNPAQVQIVEHSDTRAVVKCQGTLAGVPVVARHLIEYDGMCLTTLELAPSGSAALAGLSLYLPFRTQQATLYHWMSYGGACGGAVRETESRRAEPMNRNCPIWFIGTVEIPHPTQ